MLYSFIFGCFFEDFSKLTFIVYFGIQLFYSINNEASHMLKILIIFNFLFSKLFSRVSYF